MTVAELLEILKNEDPSKIIVLSKDSEGNSFSPLSTPTLNMVYRPKTTWYGEIGYPSLTEELETLGYGEDDVISDGIPCIIFWPIN